MPIVKYIFTGGIARGELTLPQFDGLEGVISEGMRHLEVSPD